MTRFSPLLVYVVWGAILVGSLVVDHRSAPTPVACVRPASGSAPPEVAPAA